MTLLQPAAAIAVLRSHIGQTGWKGDCEKFQRICWNDPDFSDGSYGSAREHFLAIPDPYRHPWGSAMPGHLLFYDELPFGHIVTVSKPGWCVTNDTDDKPGHIGGIYEVPISRVNEWLGRTPRAACDPYWHGQVHVIGAPPPQPAPQPPSGRKAPAMAVMYIRALDVPKGVAGHAVLIESGKQVLMNSGANNHANGYSADGLPYAQSKDPDQDARYDRVYGPVQV